MARENPGEVWKIQNLLATIKTEVEAREASNLMKGMSKAPPPISTASSLYAGGQSRRCVYCAGDHYHINVKDACLFATIREMF